MVRKAIEVRGLRKAFDTAGGGKLPVLDGLSFSVEEGGITSVVGPSGCGKTTLLRIIAGVERADGGEVELPATGGGSLSLVYQQNDLLPWLTAEDNVELAVRAKGYGRTERKETVDRCLDRVGLTGFGSYYPSRLSGGMQKRLSLARALAADAEVILCDEPLAFLDFQSRADLQDLVEDLFLEQRKTILYVTHDVHEAVRLSRETLVLSALPATVKMSVDIPFDYPRGGDDLELSREYHDIVIAMKEALREERQRGAGAARRGEP